MDDALISTIRSHATATLESERVPIEHVAANVTRQRGFSNVGDAASGHTTVLDEPTSFGGTGRGPDPAEALLIAIGASLSVTLTVRAALAGLHLGRVAVALRGKLDPVRFFAPSPEPGGGLYDLELDVALGGDAVTTEMEDLLAQALQACPVLRSVTAIPTVRLTIGERA